MDYRTPLAEAKGLGSAKSGTVHWWMQRVTAVALIPLSFWPIKLLALVLSSPYRETVDWLTAPVNNVCLSTWIIAVFYHASLGLQVVIEDYVSGEGKKIVSVWTVNLIFLLLAISALLAVLRILSIG